jgi:cytidyltransferase-like protein
MKLFSQYFYNEQVIPDKEVNSRTVALVPGSFKPPHKGHFEMFKYYANKADRVIVVISDPQNPKSIRTTPEGKYIPAKTAKEIFELYAKNENVRNITFVTDPSPVKFVYDYFAERTQPGDKVILGVGGKGEDAARYKNAAKYAPEGVELDIDVFAPVGGDSPISASDIRNKLDALTIEDLLPYIPDRLRDNEAVVNAVYNALTTLPE